MTHSGNFEPRSTDYCEEHISPTLFVPTYGRSFSDIPLSQELYDAVKGISALNALEEESAMATASRYEARYKIIDKLIAESRVPRIVEIAAGLSPRGLAYTRNSDSVRYVEFDLPHIVEMKRNVIAKVVQASTGTHENLIQVAGNAFIATDIKKAANEAGEDGPIVFTNEGLMRYFSFDEKRLLAENILSVLADRGGAWITTDISLPSFQQGTLKGLESAIAKLSGIDLSKNYFNDIDHAKKFFNGIGFQVEVRSFLEVKDKISSAKRLNVSDDELEKQLGSSFAFMMTPMPDVTSKQ